MLSWLLLLVGLAMVVAGLFVGVISREVTLALIVVGAVVALAGAFMLVRRGRGAV
jgi:predicted MFS family arabinose efflux permease